MFGLFKPKDYQVYAFNESTGARRVYPGAHTAPSASSACSMARAAHPDFILPRIVGSTPWVLRSRKLTPEEAQAIRAAEAAGLPAPFPFSTAPANITTRRAGP